VLDTPWSGVSVEVKSTTWESGRANGTKEGYHEVKFRVTSGPVTGNWSQPVRTLSRRGSSRSVATRAFGSTIASTSTRS